VVIPNLKQVTDKLTDLAKEWKNISLLARTHGQPASPTRLGKELYVFRRAFRRFKCVQCLMPFRLRLNLAELQVITMHTTLPTHKLTGDSLVKNS
jgi:fumarate hydratase class II